MRDVPSDLSDVDPKAEPRFLTVILRFPIAVSDAFRAATKGLEAIEPVHLYYPPEAIHLTLADASSASTSTGRITADVREIAASLCETDVEVVGLRLTDRSLSVGILPSAGLRHARAALIERWRLDPLNGPEGQGWHSTIARFAARPSKAFVRAAAQVSLEPSSIRVVALELVRTNKVMAADRTTCLVSLALADRGPG